MSGMIRTMQDLVVHPAYILAVLLVVQPINGVLIERGQLVLGLAMIATQVPLAIRIAFKMHNDKLSGGEAVRSDALLDDIHDALMECPSHDDGEAYPESKLITLGDAWAVLEQYRKSSNIGMNNRRHGCSERSEA